MSDSKILIPLGKAVTISANALGTLQVGIDKVLWGSIAPSTVQTANFNTTTGTLNYKTTTTAATKPSGNLIESGLFNALDALNSVDLCNVIAYLTDLINIKKGPRPEKPWNAAQTLLYTLQDQAAFVRTQIDKFTAYPNVFIGSYVGTGPNAVPLQQAVSQSNAPGEGGSQVTAYNLYFLMKSIKDTFSFNSTGTGSLFTAEDKILLSTVPGLGGNLNIIDDFIGTIEKYSDYRNIPNAELQNLINKINTLRSVCVTIENLDFKSALALIGNFLGTDIRAQIQKLSDFLNPTKIIPTLKQINSALLAFINIAKRVQGVLSLGQLLIKIILVFNKIFKFIQQFITNAPIPAATQTTGTISRLEGAKLVAKTETDGITVLLKTINSLLQVAVNFIRYILANTNELLRRLDILLANLEACAAVKDSDVISELQATRSSLIDLRDQFATYITQYDSKTDSNNSMFGVYDIRVVDEEVTDRAITNKRRRGIALNIDGQIVTQSDLTFATNTKVIIAEVQQKLMFLGLVESGMGQLDVATLDTIATSINYLDSNDVLETDLNIDASALSSAQTIETLNISNFIGQLPGGKKFQESTKTTVSDYTANAKQQAETQKGTLSGSIK
jgi:hypothetical protein